MYKIYLKNILKVNNSLYLHNFLICIISLKTYNNPQGGSSVGRGKVANSDHLDSDSKLSLDFLTENLSALSTTELPFMLPELT